MAPCPCLLHTSNGTGNMQGKAASTTRKKQGKEATTISNKQGKGASATAHHHKQ